MKTSSSSSSLLSLYKILSILLISQIVSSLVTLESIRDLTRETVEARERIVGGGDLVVFHDGNGDGEDEGERQVVLIVGTVTDAAGGGEERRIEWDGRRRPEGDYGSDEGGGGKEKDDVEILLSVAIRHVANHLWLDLERPLDGLKQDPLLEKDCDIVITQFHDFLKATTLFLYSIQERQMKWRWKSDSIIVDDLAWLQGLWASRSTNIQNRSFIEQQLLLYGATTCFGKTINRQVLRRDVEIVEYLNDLLDMFE